MADRNPFYLECTRCAFCELGPGGHVRSQPRGVQPCGLGKKVYNNNGKFNGKFCTKLETIRRSAIGIRLPITSGGLYVCSTSRLRNRRAPVPIRPRTSPRRADDDPQSSQEPRGATAAAAAGVVVRRAKAGKTSEFGGLLAGSPSIAPVSSREERALRRKSTIKGQNWSRCRTDQVRRAGCFCS